MAENAAEQDFKQSLKKHHKHHKNSKTKFINDHYDGKKSDGLENGAKKHDYSAYTNDHYDDAEAKHKGGKDVSEEQPKLTKA